MGFKGCEWALIRSSEMYKVSREDVIFFFLRRKIRLKEAKVTCPRSISLIINSIRIGIQVFAFFSLILYSQEYHCIHYS